MNPGQILSSVKDWVGCNFNKRAPPLPTVGAPLPLAVPRLTSAAPLSILSGQLFTFMIYHFFHFCAFDKRNHSASSIASARGRA